MRPGSSAVCPGEVFHRRLHPEVHAFRYAVTQVWIDPERPEELCAAHPLWSARRPAPVMFRAQDYGGGDPQVGALAAEVRRDLSPVLGRAPRGPIRLLAQPRTWGWLFNPIAVFVAWDDPTQDPVGLIAEVTNTPWKERHRYPVALTRSGDRLVAEFVKELHVSPFLDESHTYALSLRADGDEVELRIDVMEPDGRPVVETRLVVERRSPDRAALGAMLRTNPLATHRVSAGIHVQAARLWRKGVPFVAHPRARSGRGDPHRVLADSTRGER